MWNYEQVVNKTVVMWPPTKKSQLRNKKPEVYI